MPSVSLVSAPQVTVAVSGTEQRLVAANVQNVVALYLSAPAANTGAIHIGDSGVSTTEGLVIVKGTTQVINAPDGLYLDIYNMYADAGTGGDKINVAYLVRV